MHDNVDISKELQETKELFDSVLLTQGASGGGGGGKADEALNAICEDILKKVNNSLGLLSLFCRNVIIVFYICKCLYNEVNFFQQPISNIFLTAQCSILTMNIVLNVTSKLLY